MDPAGPAVNVRSIGTDPDVVGPMVPGLVSIVIPCYRGTPFLAEAIESCLGQTYSDIEIIVVDDASPDDCSEIAERYARQDGRLRVIRRPANGGVSRAFNGGFEVARGEYFARLAQDDRFREDAIAIMVRHIEDHPDAGLVYCDSYTINDDGKIFGKFTAPDPGEFLADRCCLGVCVLWPGPCGTRSGVSTPNSTRPRTTNTGAGLSNITRYQNAMARPPCSSASMNSRGRSSSPCVSSSPLQCQGSPLR